MMQQRAWRVTAHATRSTVVTASLVLALLTSTADARGIHGAGRGMRGAEFAGGHRHGNDAYIKAASEDRDRLLNTRLKSICRGC
jgi:hypothetical protein